MGPIPHHKGATLPVGYLHPLTFVSSLLWIQD